MRYTLTAHAHKRLRERNISERLIADALENPTKLLSDDRGRLLLKKLYVRHGKERLLLIAAEVVQNELVVITVIDTSKIKKYLSTTMKGKPKISYDRESEVLSVEMHRGKSVDSDVRGNVVIDYDAKGNVVRVNFYKFNFDAFRSGAKALRRYAERQPVGVR